MSSWGGGGGGDDILWSSPAPHKTLFQEHLLDKTCEMLPGNEYHKLRGSLA